MPADPRTTWALVQGSIVELELITVLISIRARFTYILKSLGSVMSNLKSTKSRFDSKAVFSSGVFTWR